MNFLPWENEKFINLQAVKEKAIEELFLINKAPFFVRQKDKGKKDLRKNDKKRNLFIFIIFFVYLVKNKGNFVKYYSHFLLFFVHFLWEKNC